jgi:hypothetical protein
VSEISARLIASEPCPKLRFDDDDAVPVLVEAYKIRNGIVRQGSLSLEPDVIWKLDAKLGVQMVDEGAACPWRLVENVGKGCCRKIFVTRRELEGQMR